MCKSNATYQGDDPLLFKDQLTEDERMIRDAERQYCRRKLMSREFGTFRHEKTDPKILREMGELGLQGCLRLGRMKDAGTAAVEITSIMKRNSCDKALEVSHRFKKKEEKPDGR
jgi:hypothetical protein